MSSRGKVALLALEAALLRRPPEPSPASESKQSNRYLLCLKHHPRGNGLANPGRLTETLPVSDTDKCCRARPLCRTPWCDDQQTASAVS